MCLSSNCLKKLSKQESVKRKTRGQELHIGKWKTLEGAEASSSFDHISTMPTQRKAIFIRSRTEFINYLSDAWRWAALSSDRWLETWNFPVQLYLAFGSVLCSAKNTHCIFSLASKSVDTSHYISHLTFLSFCLHPNCLFWDFQITIILYFCISLS